MGVNSDVEHYLCEQCEPRSVNRVKKKKSPLHYYSYKLKQLLHLYLLRLARPVWDSHFIV